MASGNPYCLLGWRGIPTGIERTVACTMCWTEQAGVDAWQFGVMDEHTHVFVLRGLLAAQCDRDDCPNTEVLEAAAETHGAVGLDRALHKHLR